MTSILAIALIITLALFLRERRLRQSRIREWSIAYKDLWGDYTFIAHTLEEITGIDIL
jgi:hypothetical protein